MNNMDFESNESSPVITIAALIVIFAGGIYARTIITPVLLALFISIICVQPIAWLVKKKIPQGFALLIVLLGIILLFSGFMFMIGRTLSSISGNLAKYESAFTTMNQSLGQFLNAQGLNIAKGLDTNLIDPAKILKYAQNAFGKIFSLMGNILLILLIVLFMLMEFRTISDKITAIFRVSNKSVTYLSTILHNIRRYLILQTLVCISIGILIYIALLIIGVDYPLLWAVIAGILNYIPNIGSIIAAVPAVLFAKVQLGTGGALWTLGAYMLVHNIIGNFFVPQIMGKGLGLSTLVVFLSMLFWGFILGIVGMFLSVPITMSIKIFLEQNEKTRWLAILLGTAADAKHYFQHKERIKTQRDKKSL